AARRTGVSLTAVEIAAVEISAEDPPTLGESSPHIPADPFTVAGRCPSGPLHSPTWAKEYGLGPEGAVLIRPDGHVAWRSPDGPASAPALTKAVDRVLSRR
ncbi:hypothetical protein AB0J22_47900, partial [Nonomuraea dietziae]